MWKTTLKALLGVLCLALVLAMNPATAAAADDGGAIVVKERGPHQANLIVNTDGTSDDDQSGDPDTAGDTLGYRKVTDLISGSDSATGMEERLWAGFVLVLVNFMVIMP